MSSTRDPAASILSVETVDGGFRISGQVDLSSIQRFREAVASGAADGSELVLDLSGCTFLGSEGIGVLIDAVKAIGSGKLILRSPPGIISKVLELAGVAKLPNVQMATA